MQTLADVATEKNSTTIFPVPIDLLTPFMEFGKALTRQKVEEITEDLDAHEKKHGSKDKNDDKPE